MKKLVFSLVFIFSALVTFAQESDSILAEETKEISISETITESKTTNIAHTKSTNTANKNISKVDFYKSLIRKNNLDISLKNKAVLIAKKTATKTTETSTGK